MIYSKLYINRRVEAIILKNLFRGDIVVLYGARQVGKTTLVKKIQKNFKESSLYLNCDEADDLRKLSASDTSQKLKSIIGENELIIIDEAQRVPNIGLKLKLIADNFPKQQIIATGSSSFDLSNKVSEPLTGRSIKIRLDPISASELKFTSNKHFESELENLLIFGSYPRVAVSTNKENRVSQISDNYLYNDLLEFSGIKDSELIRRLLAALALQIGNEVSYSELSRLLGASKETIRNYTSLLEKVFIIFTLPPFKRNLRTELRKLRKVYFFDLGIRNSLIKNFNPLNLRTDTGPLWENFVIAEKKKHENFTGNLSNLYFWRTHAKQEIDLVEEKGGKLFATEIKWNKLSKRPPKAWSDTYKESEWSGVTKDNYYQLYLKQS